MVSGVRSFFRFLLTDDQITTDPAELLELPKLRRKLPDTLSYEEIENIIGALDLKVSRKGCGIKPSLIHYTDADYG